MKLVSWNVNGIRAVERKGFLAWLTKSNYDVVCLQETKISDPEILSPALRAPSGYTSYWNCCQPKKGYSGVATYVKAEPKKVSADFGRSILSDEGRLQELDFGDFILLNGYFPNGKSGEPRLKYKMDFYREFLKYVNQLKQSGRSIIFTGDVNTAHQEIDLARPKENSGVSGFLPAERAWIDEVVAAGFADSFRLFTKEGGHYSWWDQKSSARTRNVGWRIDYFFVSQDLVPRVERAWIEKEVPGSDHAPVGLEIK